MASEMERVRGWLRSRWKVSVPDDWLEACIHWIQQENEGQPLTPGELNNQVYQQWLQCDLRELGTAQLPINLAQQPKTLLTGPFCLQVESVTDVSQPYYGQHQKVKGTENANAQVSATQPSQPPWEPKASRMLMLKITDGVQDVQGMEYQPIPAINPNLIPGTKVVVTGNVLCRLGVLMLKRENITVLGGEVEQLIEENTQEAVIQRALITNTGMLARHEHRMEFDTSANRNQQSKSPVPQRPHAGGNSTFKQPTSANIRKTSSNRTCNAMKEEDAGFVDDDILDHLDGDTLLAMESQWDDSVDDESLLSAIDTQDSQRNVSMNGSSRAHTNYSSQVSTGGSTGWVQQLQRKPSSTNQATHLDHSVKRSRLYSDEVKIKSESVKSEPSNRCLLSSVSNVRTGATRVPVVKQEPIGHSQTETRPTLLNTVSSSAHRQLPKRTGPPYEIDDFDEDQLIELAENIEMEMAEDMSNEWQHKKPVALNRGCIGSHAALLSTPSSSIQRPISSTAENRALVIEPQLTRLPIDLHSKPFTYLNVVMKALPPAVRTEVTVKVYISTLCGRLEHNNGTKWSLPVKINDGTGSVLVDLSDQMLTDLIGFTAPVSMVIKNKPKSAFDPSELEKKKELALGIKRCQKTLVGLSCLLDLLLHPAHKCPQVLRHRKITHDDVKALKKRLT